MYLPEDDKRLISESAFRAMLSVGLGGRAAEEIVFGDINTGASQDLQRVTQLARAMVTRYGMSKKLGPRTFGEREELIFLGRQLSEQRNYSEEIAEQIDYEVRRLVDEANERAHKLLSDNLDKLKLIAETLLGEETLTAEQFIGLIGGKGSGKLPADGSPPTSETVSGKASAKDRDDTSPQVLPPSTAPLPA
jgi:cell division protease FtsH